MMYFGMFNIHRRQFDMLVRNPGFAFAIGTEQCLMTKDIDQSRYTIAIFIDLLVGPSRKQIIVETAGDLQAMTYIGRHGHLV